MDNLKFKVPEVSIIIKDLIKIREGTLPVSHFRKSFDELIIISARDPSLKECIEKNALWTDNLAWFNGQNFMESWFDGTETCDFKYQGGAFSPSVASLIPPPSNVIGANTVTLSCSIPNFVSLAGSIVVNYDYISGSDESKGTLTITDGTKQIVSKSLGTNVQTGKYNITSITTSATLDDNFNGVYCNAEFGSNQS